MQKDNIKAVRKALLNLPRELDGMYGEAMQRIWSQDHDKVERAKQVLSWICCSLRPLTVTGIQHALAVEPGDANFDEEALPDEDILVSVCAGLVTIDQKSNIIRLVHYTIREYSERIPSLLPSFYTLMQVLQDLPHILSFDAFVTGSGDSIASLIMHVKAKR